MFVGQGFGPLQNVPRAIVRLPHFALFFIRHVMIRRGKNLVDLCAVK